MSPPQNLVENAVKEIRNDVKHDRGLDAIREELNKLEQAHADDKNPAALKADLRQVGEMLHKQGILPRVDFVATSEGDAVLLGISGDGKADGHGQRLTAVRGMTFEYDKSGHVTKYSTDKGKSVWTYSKEDGQYHESVDGQPSGNVSSDVVTMNSKGRMEVTHADGSTTETLRWGAVIERDPHGRIVEERRGHNIREFQYDNGKLVGVSDFPTQEAKDANQPSNSYTLDPATKKFYSATDTGRTDPLEIKILEETGDLGTTEITHKDGSRDLQRIGGTVSHWNKDNELTGIEYKNGNTATDFTYDSKHHLTGFKMTGKDGVTHTYQSKDGHIIIDAGTENEKKIKGNLENDDHGTLAVTEVGNGSDDQYKSTKFKLNGVVVEAGLAGVTRVIDGKGQEHTFDYKGDDLQAINAFGYQMKRVGDKWVDAQGNPTGVTPKVGQDGTLYLYKPDGTFDAVTAGGIKFAGEKEPEPPEPPSTAVEGRTGNIAKDLLYWAKRCLGKQLWRDERNSEVDSGLTAHGVQGCSASVSAILGMADVDRGEEDGPHNSNFLSEGFGKTALAKRLASNLDALSGWDRIHFTSHSQLQEGDIIDGVDSNGINGHIGIVGPKVNGQWTVYENRSSTGRWEQHPLDWNFEPGNARFGKRMWLIRPPD